MIDLVHYVYKQFPHLKRDLFAAHLQTTPQDYIRQVLLRSFTYSILLCVLAFFPIASAKLPIVLIVLLFPVIFFFMIAMQMAVPKAMVARRGREIDNEVLFAGRFLLIKLSSGRPLFNALIDTSESYGVASKYFKEIVDDINFGTPIEIALNNAMEASPSKYFKRILFQINNALKTGIDVTQNLELVIQEVENEQVLEIERYAKKLSSIALFYMLGAIVLPSLGMTIFVVVSSLISFQITVGIYAVMLVFIVMLQLFFISVFRQIRPSVNL